MYHSLGRKSQISNREYDLDNYSIDTICCLDRWPRDGLQSVSYLPVRIEPSINDLHQFYPIGCRWLACYGWKGIRLAAKFYRSLGCAVLLKFVTAILLNLLKLFSRQTMFMDSPMTILTKNDGIISLMHCQEKNFICWF